MYERSAIVLERYMERILKFNKEYNLKRNNQNYSELISEIEEYQTVTEKELEVIQEFDDTAKEIENLQQEQEKIYKENKKLEDNRAQLFTELGEEAQVLEVKLKQIEGTLEKNNEKLKEIRTEFVKYLTDFSKKQRNRNKCEKARRIGEANHIGYLERMHTEFDELDVKDVVNLKDFINFEKEQVKQEALEIMIKNGKSERVAFNQDVLKRAIKARIDIAEKEAECYILVYEKMKKLLAEPDSETIRLNKYKKTLRDTSVKLAFLNAQREYIVGFLDYERMTAISGEKMHKKMMIEACNNFELDMMQIAKLYELILRETTNRSTKKGYNQLYNKTYLRNIEDKEKNFQQEVNNVNISMGTVINSNYWRIEGIKNIYNVFQEEVSTKFGKDLSELKLEESDNDEDLLAEPKKVEKAKRHKKEEKEEIHKQFKYKDYEEDDDNDEIIEYNNEEENDDEDEEIKEILRSEPSQEEDEEEYEDNETYNEYKYKVEDYDFEIEEEEDEEEDDEYNEVIYEDDDYEDEEVEEEEEKENYRNNARKPAYNSYSRKKYYEEEDDEDDEEEYDEYDDDNYEDDSYDEDGDYDEEEYDDNDEAYRAYNNKIYKYDRAKNYIDDDDDDEYENIYEYNYDDDEAEYRKQKLQNKTVISFDDEESIDMIIANSRKKSTNKRNNSKGLFNKLFGR